MRTLYVGLIGAVLAVVMTSTLDLTVHAGSHIFSGWQGHVVAAIGGAVSAILIWRALRPNVR